MDLHLASSFEVEISGLRAASFLRVEGLGARVEVVAVEEGGAESPRLYPGRTSWEPLVFTRGWVRDTALWDWFQSHEARDGAVTLLGPDGAPRGRFRFRRGWPSGWSGPAFDAERDALALERLEIVHEGLTWEPA